MPLPKRSKIQRERDRLVVSELYLKGWTQRSIADFFELDKSVICREIKRIKLAWQKESAENYELLLAQELGRLSMLESELWKAWEESKRGKETSTLEKSATGKDEFGQALGRIRQLTRTEEQIGDVVFLTAIQRIIETRCKLLGLHWGDRAEAKNTGAVNPIQIFLPDNNRQNHLDE